MLKKKIMPLTLALCLALSVGSMCFASGESLASTLDFTGITSAVTSAITPTDIITVIAATIAAGIGFVLAWFGIRKVKGALSRAIFKGRL